MPSTDTSPAARTRPTAATVVAVLGALGMVGSAAMIVLHLTLDLPGLAVAFGLGVLAYAAVTLGALRQASWAWPVALVVNAIALASTVMPWRGLERSGLPALVAVVALGVLVSRPGRDALLYRR